TNGLVQGHKHIGRTHIPVVFWYLIFEDQVASKGVPGQLVQEAMILMQVVAKMSKDQIGLCVLFKAFKLLFDLCTLVREKTIAKGPDQKPARSVLSEKELGTKLRFLSPRRIGTEDDPCHARCGMGL